MKPMQSGAGINRNIIVVLCVTAAVALLSTGCGGDASIPPPPPDFSVSVNPAALSITVGTVSPTVLVSVSAHNGFADTVNIVIKGLPSGAFSTPPLPLAIPSTGSQQVTLFIPPSTPTGSLSIEFDATSGTLSHTATLSLAVTPVSNTAALQEISHLVAAGTIELQGLSAGTFTPAYWQKNMLNWVPDVREPMFTALTTSPYQNIYAPWPLEQPGGWRLFYGGWDGSDTPNDRVYSATTADFLTFTNRQLVIDHGAFLHVNNVNVHQIPDGSLHMVCTGGAYDEITNWPTYFSSPDGITWNGSPQPYQAQLTDIVVIQGYSDYSAGGFNGGNVLFWDNAWALYFYDNFNNDHIFRATGASPNTVQLQGQALASGADPNGVYKFTVGTQSWFLMTLMSNAPQLWYSMSSDGITFGPMQNLFYNLSAQDSSIDSLSFVTSGSRILGVLYGANTGTPDNQLSDNEIYARWLQRKVVITDSSGAQYFAQGSYGPDRQWFQAPASGTLEGTMVVYAEDGATPLGNSLVTLTAGKAYNLVLQ
jgi:hypothetical protein